MTRKLLVLNSGNCMEVQFDQQITIGRDIFNSLCLQDPEVSRSHAIIFEQEDEIIVKDLKSRNKIYVRGEKVSEARLFPGDELIIGATVIIYEPTDTLDIQMSLTPRGRYLIDHNQEGGGNNRDKGPAKPQAADHPRTSFKAEEMDEAISQLLDGEVTESTFLTMPNAIGLLKAVTELNRAESTTELFNMALKRSLAVLGGHRGVIMESDDAKDLLKVRAIISREDARTVNIGQPIIEIVLGKEKCLYCGCVPRDSRFEAAAAKASHPVYSFVAAPVKGRGELFGFVYLDSEDDSFSYDFASLRSLYFIASHVGALLCKRPIRFDHAEAELGS